MDWREDITIEELPETYQQMTEIIGLENVIKLIEHFGKQPVYFCGMDKFVSEKKRQYITKNFNGSNHRELARATGYSLVWIYEILKEEKTLSKIKQKGLFT